MNFFQKRILPKKNFSLITTLFQMEGSGIIWEKLFCNQHPFINQRSTLKKLSDDLRNRFILICSIHLYPMNIASMERSSHSPQVLTLNVELDGGLARPGKISTWWRQFRQIRWASGMGSRVDGWMRLMWNSLFEYCKP